MSLLRKGTFGSTACAACGLDALQARRLGRRTHAGNLLAYYFSHHPAWDDHPIICEGCVEGWSERARESIDLVWAERVSKEGRP